MPERPRVLLVVRRASAWWVAWLCSAALYLVLIDITDLPELIVGAGAAVLAARASSSRASSTPRES